jgi:hypothetical protein
VFNYKFSLSPSLRVLSLAIVWWNRCPHHLDQPPALTLIGLCFLSVYIAPLSPLLLERQGPTLAALSPATTGKMGMIRVDLLEGNTFYHPGVRGASREIGTWARPRW